MITKVDKRFFGIARSVAITSTHHKVHIGCVLVKGRDVLSVGVNKEKTHPKQMHYDKFRLFDDPELCKHNIHAELDAIIKAKHIPKGTSIYVYRVKRDGSPGVCRPCVACINLIKDSGIKDIFYTTNEGLCYENLC